MRVLRFAALFLVALLWMPSIAFAQDQADNPIHFTVKAASFDSSGCYMSLVHDSVEYSVRGGSILHACPIFNLGTVLKGRFRNEKRSIVITYTGQDGKEKTQNYEVREATLLPH